MFWTDVGKTSARVLKVFFKVRHGLDFSKRLNGLE